MYGARSPKNFFSFGYQITNFIPFEIDIDINKPKHCNWGYCTVTINAEKGLAFITCLCQPEGFLFATK